MQTDLFEEVMQDTLNVDDEMFSEYSPFVQESLRVWSKALRSTDQPFAISFSGGKDSTCLLILASILVRKGVSPERFHILTADTKIETPIMVAQIDRAQRYCDTNGIGMSIVHPEMDERFFVKLFGHGYAPPNRLFRWCTTRLKTNPLQSARTGITTTGVRFGESTARDEKLNAATKKKSKKKGSTSCEKGSGECGMESGGDVFKPILHWRSCQVWDFLSEALVFGDITEDLFSGLRDLYSLNGSIDESLRTGCMGCPLVARDKSLEAFVWSKHGQGYEPLLLLHGLYKEMAEERNRVFRADRLESSRGTTGGGKYTLGSTKISARKRYFAQLLDIESRVQQQHPGFVLVPLDEKKLIFEMIEMGKYPSNYPKGFTEETQQHLYDEVEKLNKTFPLFSLT